MDEIVSGYSLERHHFAYFVGCCKALISLIKVSDMEMAYQFLESGEEEIRASMTLHDRCNRIATISLYDTWDVEPTEYRLWMTAFHEVIELLFCDVACMAQQRDFDYLLYDREHHRIIRILEKAWFEEMWKYGHEIFNFQSKPKGRNVSRPELPDLDYRATVPNPGLRKDKRSKK